MFLSKRSGIYYLFYFRDGKRFSVSTKCNLKRDALKFLSDFREGLHTVPQHLHYKLADVIPKILNIVKSDFSKSTFDKYSISLRNFLSICGNHYLEYYTPQHPEIFKAELLKKVNGTTTNIQVKTLKASFNLMKRLNLTSNNPFDRTKLIRQPEREKLIFTDYEIQMLLSNIDTKLIRDIVYFALETACRVSEIVNVKWQHVNFAEGFILIANDKGSGFLTKSRRERKIPISAGLRELLQQMQCGNVHSLEAFNDFIFKLEGRKVRREWVSKRFTGYVKQFGFDAGLTFHHIRHTRITGLIRSGVPLPIVQKTAGHSGIEVTMGYCHLDFNDVKKHFA